MVLSVLSCHSSQIRACHVALSSIVRQWSFQGINVDPIIDPSPKSIKDSLYPKSKERKTDEKARNYLKQNSTKITGQPIKSCHLFILC